jgi:uncharacterized protein (TIGR00369 family)
MGFEARNPDWESTVRESFAAQSMMDTLGATIVRLEPGVVEFDVAFLESTRQQDGFLHAGVAMATVDSACGYAAFSLMPSGSRVLTVDSTIKLLAPADGPLRVRGEVVRSGATLMTCRGDAWVRGADGAERHVATTLTTMIRRSA